MAHSAMFCYKIEFLLTFVPHLHHKVIEKLGQNETEAGIATC